MYFLCLEIFQKCFVIKNCRVDVHIIGLNLLFCDYGLLRKTKQQTNKFVHTCWLQAGINCIIFSGTQQFKENHSQHLCWYIGMKEGKISLLW